MVPAEVTKEVVGKDLGPECHVSFQVTDSGSIRVEVTYNGVDGKGGVWFEESPKNVVDRLIKFLPTAYQPMGSMLENVILGLVPKVI